MLAATTRLVSTAALPICSMRPRAECSILFWTLVGRSAGVWSQKPAWKPNARVPRHAVTAPRGGKPGNEGTVPGVHRIVVQRTGPVGYAPAVTRDAQLWRGAARGTVAETHLRLDGAIGLHVIFHFHVPFRVLIGSFDIYGGRELRRGGIWCALQCASVRTIVNAPRHRHPMPTLPPHYVWRSRGTGGDITHRRLRRCLRYMRLAHVRKCVKASAVKRRLRRARVMWRMVQKNAPLRSFGGT